MNKIKKYENINININTVKNENNENNINYNEIENRIENIINHLKLIKEDNIDNNKIEMKKNEIKELKEEINKLENEYKKLENDKMNIIKYLNEKYIKEEIIYNVF